MPTGNDAIRNGSDSFWAIYEALKFTLLVFDRDRYNDEFNIFEPQPKRQRTIKSRFTREDQANSVFSVLYIKPFDDCTNNNNENNDNMIELMDDTNEKAIAFRNDFRVPYVAFLSICDFFKTRNTKVDATGCPTVDCYLLVLSTL